MAKLISVSVVS